VKRQVLINGPIHVVRRRIFMGPNDFFNTFKSTLIQIASNPGFSQSLKTALANLKPTEMNTMGRQLLTRVVQEGQLAVVKCEYTLGPTTFCTEFPADVCSSVGNEVDDCDGHPNDWSGVDFTKNA
jgi:hypothetical protein